MIARHQQQPVRTGAITSFPTLAALTPGFSRVASMLPIHDKKEFVERYNDTQPPNVLNLALRNFKDEDTCPRMSGMDKITELADANWEVLEKGGVRRV